MNPDLFARQRRSIIDRLIDTLVRMFDALGSWHRGDAVRFSKAAVPVVEGAQTALASLTSNYVASVASEALGRPVAPPPIPARARLRLRGVDPQEVYRRPFVEAYTALGKGDSLDAALDKARVRLREVAEGDMQQTHAAASREAMQALEGPDRPSGWRRVLVGEYNCALCVVASTQLYHIGVLKAIHPACDCDIRPVFGTTEHVIEPELLEKVHAAVKELTGHADRGARAPDYRNIMTQMTNTHGELGPMLARPRDRFTGPDDVPDS